MESLRKYLPDFLIRFNNGDHMILEIKGVERDKDKKSGRTLMKWCKAVSATKRYGKWTWDVSETERIKGCACEAYSG